MTEKELILDMMRERGKEEALDLRRRALTLDGTGLIAEERKIPRFDPQKDYTGWAVGSPVADEGQVWILMQPHNAANYSGRPSSLRALWGLCHTKDPAAAKTWVDPMGTSGMYMLGECYRDENGKIWRALRDDLVFQADVYPEGWEAVT